MLTGFQIRLWELLGLIAFAALAIFALLNSSDAVAHWVITAELLLVVLAISFVPSSSGPKQRFLVAFVCSALACEVFSTSSWYSPFEIVVEETWLATAKFRMAVPPTRNDDPGPRAAELIAFRATAQPLIGLSLAVISGFLARALQPDRQSRSVVGAPTPPETGR